MMERHPGGARIRGVQEAVFRLGKVPRYHQTDNSTSATHDLRNGKRGFNAEYLSQISQQISQIDSECNSPHTSQLQQHN